MRILVADDHPPTLQRLATALSSRGRVTAVSSGFAALAAIQAAHQQGDPFELVVLDITMPLGDGISTARALRIEGDDLVLWGLTRRSFRAPESWPFDAVWGKEHLELLMLGLQAA